MMNRNQSPATRTVIGIGNADRGDDAVGLLVARRVRAVQPADCDIHETHGEGTALLELWRGYARVIVVDAVWHGGAAGTIHRLDAHAATLPAEITFGSSHAVGLREAVELARALGELPPRLLIVGIAGAAFRLGDAISPGVLAGVARAADEIITDLRHHLK